MLVWIATCSTRNHTADQLCSNRSLAMVTSLFSWFRSASKSCFIEGTSGESQNIPEVPITTPEFVCLPAFTHEETERPSGCCHSNFHSIMDVTGPCWASCGNVCSATCCLPKPGRFCVNLCVLCFHQELKSTPSKRAHYAFFWNVSLHWWAFTSYSHSSTTVSLPLPLFFLWKESHFCIQVTVQTLYVFTVVQLRSENWEAEARATDMGKTQILPTAASVLERTCHHVSLTSSRKNGIWFHINSISVNSISLNRVTLISSEQTIRMTDSSLRIAKD